MKSSSTQELLQRLEAIEATNKLLEEKQSWLERMLGALGLKGPWLSPGKAAPFLCMSRDRIMDEINLAEYMRQRKMGGDLVYGIHYRNIQNVIDSEDSTWQVNITTFGDVMAIPPDQRRIPIESRKGTRRKA